jgi:hypothetical protein
MGKKVLSVSDRCCCFCCLLTEKVSSEVFCVGEE